MEHLLRGILKEASNLTRFLKEYEEIGKGNLNPQLCKEDCEMCDGSGKVAEFERDENGNYHEYREVTCPNLIQEWDNTEEHDEN